MASIANAIADLAGSTPKVFISQPMRDKTEEEILAVRAEALERAKNILEVDEVREIPSYVPSFKNDHPVRSLGKSIGMLADADLVVFCKGWESMRGCRIEYAVCSEYGLRHEEI